MTKLSAGQTSAAPEKVFADLIKTGTKTLVVEHELNGVTPELIDWWWFNINNENYKLWHPKDHHTFAWQIPPSMTEDGRTGAIHIACESINNIPASIIRVRWENPSSALTPTTYDHVAVGSVLSPGPEDKPLSCIVHEYEATSYGTRMRSTFSLPVGIPEEFINELRIHNIEEMGEFPKFLPELHRKEVKTT